MPAILLPGGMLRGQVSTAAELFAVTDKHLRPAHSTTSKASFPSDPAAAASAARG